MGRPKIWNNCSQQEKDDVQVIEDLFNEAKKSFKEGLMPIKEYVEFKSLLVEGLDEVKRKYD